MVPSDFGKALEGFTRMLGAPGDDGVFRFEPSPVEDGPVNRPEDDDDAVRDWFDTAPDPALARAVAEAEHQARRPVPPPGVDGGAPAVPPVAPRPRIAPPAPQGLPAGAPPQHQPAQHQPAQHQPAQNQPALPAQPRPAQPRPAAGQEGGPTLDESESAVPTPPRGIPQVPLDDPHATPATPARGAPQADPVSRAGQSRPEGGRDGDHETPARPGYPSPPPR
jgi:hypothetical protein